MSHLWSSPPIKKAATSLIQSAFNKSLFAEVTANKGILEKNNKFLASYKEPSGSEMTNLPRQGYSNLHFPRISQSSLFYTRIQIRGFSSKSCQNFVINREETVKKWIREGHIKNQELIIRQPDLRQGHSSDWRSFTIKILGTILASAGLAYADYLRMRRNEGAELSKELRSYTITHFSDSQDSIEEAYSQEIEPVLGVYGSWVKEDIDKLLQKNRKLSKLIEQNKVLESRIEKYLFQPQHKVEGKDILEFFKWIVSKVHHYSELIVLYTIREEINYIKDKELMVLLNKLEITFAINEAVIDFKLKKFASAEEKINKLIKELEEKIKNNNEEVGRRDDKNRLLLINSYLIKARIERGRSIYENNNQYLNNALESYDNALKLDKENPLLLTHKAFCHNDKGEHQEAFKLHLMANEFCYGSAGIIDGLAYGLYQLAIDLKDSCAKQEDVNEKIEGYKKLLTEGKASSLFDWNFTNLDSNQLQKLLFEKSLELYDKALQLQPNQPVHLSQRGILYLDMGLYKEALEDFKIAISLKKYYPIAHAGYARALCQLEKYDDASKQIKIAKNFYTNIPINSGNTPYQTKKIIERLTEDTDRIKKMENKSWFFSKHPTSRLFNENTSTKNLM